MEEIKPEERSDDQVMEQTDGSDNVSTVQKIKHILSVVTIEPVVFFHYLAFAITLVSQNQMIVYKTCRGLNCANNNPIINVCFAWNTKRKNTICPRNTVPT